MFTAQGKEEEVVNFFAMSPHLIRSLIVKNDVEDYSGRRFKNISAFQYAIGAKDWLEIENYWCYEVGMAQREVPAHIAQEYCRNDLPLRKEKRSFTEFEFPRTLDFDNWINNETELWFPLHKNHKLGYDFAIANFPREGKEVDGMWRQEWAGVGRSAPFVALRWLENLAGLLALCEVRAKQVIELGERLSKQVQQEVDLEAGKDNGMSYS
ncbi:hypothetical protein [Legionella maceachernii]|uniref:hypothetical protein n=1 Tax=Legionella maceachernii TaxID=466 RepID=UPI00072FF3FD|nr:hypothetical protein [Legionella maceachernii]